MFQKLYKLMVILFVSAMLFPAVTDAEEFRGYFSGSSFDTGVDTNNDGLMARESESIGKWSLGGKFATKALVEALPWDFASFCSPSEIKLYNVAHPTVVTTMNADLIYSVLADSPTSFTCFNFLDGISLRGETYLNVAGGTGRFSEASGEMILTWSAKSIVSSSGLVLGAVFYGEMEGEIMGPALHEDDDDSD
jgi:hypothetical protein